MGGHCFTPAKGYYAVLFCLLAVLPVRAQQPVAISNALEQHIFTYGEIEWLEDPGGRLTIAEVSSPSFSRRFRPSTQSTPQNHHLGAAYWIALTYGTTPR